MLWWLGIESRFNGNCTAGHVLFAKEHSVRSSHSSKPVGRTLFVLNVPQYYTKVILVVSLILPTRFDSS